MALSEYLALTGQFVADDPTTVHGRRIPERGCLGEADRRIYRTIEVGDDRESRELEERLTGPQHDPNEPSALEKKTATADARCKQQTGYLSTVHAVEVRIQNQLIAKNRRNGGGTAPLEPRGCP